MSRLYMQQDTQNHVDQGELQISIHSQTGQVPIEGATITLSYTGQPDSILETLSTNSSGQTENITLDTPPLEYSMEPAQNQPYAEYTIQVTAPGYEPVNVSGIELMSGVEALQDVVMTPLAETDKSSEHIVIGPHTLYGEYPPKIPEDEIKPVNESGEIVLSRVVVPEYVIVHDGPPNDRSATDHYVRFKDYIKNVASSEIYATWPETTIRANVLAILSFTLNRVYTEWYRNKGYDFTITSSTAYDHKWIHGRNVFENISYVVDEIFANYLSRPNVKQPILTQYCDGQQVQCLDRGWMTQWGSKYLGDQGYTPVEIIRYYYGDDMYINTAEQISGIPASWPGYNLSIGSSGAKVRQMQQQLDRIAQTYTAIPRITADGVYGPATAEAVRTFQQIFNLPVTGVVDYPTWYEISNIYVGISRIGELYP
ncbi:MAG: peptidoglycan-binding protein [Lachnospiraceae bacterium]|nr:peptidoglycan-binding protein [Lachnospiraceae bacterium]